MLTPSRDLPERHRRGMPAQLRRAGAPFLFGLAPGGVCPATPVTSRAVRSYRTFSPLPVFTLRVTTWRARGLVTPKLQSSEGGRYFLCGTFPGIAPGGDYPPPFPVEPGLSSPRLHGLRSPDRLVGPQHGGRRGGMQDTFPHPALRATLSRRERGRRLARSVFPLPPGEVGGSASKGEGSTAFDSAPHTTVIR